MSGVQAPENRKGAPAGAILRVFYASRQARQAPRGGWSTGIEAILESSRRNNRAEGLTGVLLCVEDRFLQIIEGAPDAVARAFERIACDFRHTDVELLELSSTDRRICGDWAMHAIGDGGRIGAELRDELQDIRMLARSNSREAVRRIRAVMQHDAKSAERRAATAP